MRRNVAELAELPTGQQGRPSKAMTLGQAKALMAAAEQSRSVRYCPVTVHRDQARGSSGLAVGSRRPDSAPDEDLVVRRMSTCGGLPGCTATSRLPSRAVRSRFRRQPWTRFGNSGNYRTRTGLRPVSYGRTATSCSPRRSARRSLGPNNVRRDFRHRYRTWPPRPGR